MNTAHDGALTMFSAPAATNSVACGVYGQRIGNKKPATGAGAGILAMGAIRHPDSHAMGQAASAFTRAFSREILRDTVFL